MCVIQSAALRGKHPESIPNSDAAKPAKTAKHATTLPEVIFPRISLAELEAMADWKEAIQGRIECARVRLNLGLPDNDPQLSTEVAEFVKEVQFLCVEMRDAQRRGVS